MQARPNVRLKIRRLEGKGRGMFAAEAIKAGDLIEQCPVLLVPSDQVAKLEGTLLQHYVFLQDDGSCVFALGFGSLYNHSYQPNATFGTDTDHQVLQILAYRDIEAGEEITINYGGSPDSTKPVNFHVL